MEQVRIDGSNEPLDSMYFVDMPQQWPLLPFLAMKRYDEEKGMEHGVIFAGEPYVVRKVNVFLLPESLDEFLNRPSIKYSDAEEIVSDGWRVD